MIVLITGSTGFVGKNLIAYLERNAIKTRQLSREEVWENPELDEDIIIHLAGKAHDLKRKSSDDGYDKANFKLTKKLYDTFLISKAQKFIFISSVKAIADEVTGILTEGTFPQPKTAYGKSKLKAEEYIINHETPPTKHFYILRPCMIHGPGNKGNLNLLFQLIKKGIPYPLAGFENKRSFLSIENLCFIIKELITRNDIPGGIYQVADDEPLSTNQVVTILAEAINVKPKLWKISPELIKIFAKIGNIIHLPLTTARLQKLTENFIVSNNKIRKALGKHLPSTAKKGLQQTATSFTVKI